MDQNTRSRRVAFLLDNLAGGGAEKVMLNLAHGMAGLGHPVDLLVCKMEGALRDKIPENVNLVHLKASTSHLGILCALVADPATIQYVVKMFIGARKRKLPGTFRFMPALVDYLKTSQPAGLISALPRTNINAVLAKRYSGQATRVVVSVHVNYSFKEQEAQRNSKTEADCLQALVRRYYRQADVVVGVSKGVAENISEYAGIPRDRVTVVYNPIASPSIHTLARKNTRHPWLESGDLPVILGIGRFVAQKNFPLLLRAFARVREKIPARLILLGGDESSAEQCLQKEELAEMAVRLGVRDDFDMPGFVSNPYSYLKRAALFVLSSRYEGFGNVLVEALLCGCPVVSTDCPSGPAEILDGGMYGRLVPIDDEAALEDAMRWTLENPPDENFLRARGEEFSIENAAECYRSLIFESHAM